MPYAALEKEIEKLDDAQQNAAVMFVHFLLSQGANGGGGIQEVANDDSPALGKVRDKAMMRNWVGLKRAFTSHLILTRLWMILRSMCDAVPA